MEVKRQLQRPKTKENDYYKPNKVDSRPLTVLENTRFERKNYLESSLNKYKRP